MSSRVWSSTNSLLRRRRTSLSARLFATEAAGVDGGAGSKVEADKGSAAPTRKQKGAARSTTVKLDNFVRMDFDREEGADPREFKHINLTREHQLDRVLTEEQSLSAEAKADIAALASFKNASDREIMQRTIKNTVSKYQRFEGDTGSTEVQVAVLSERILWLRAHMAKNGQDMVTKKALTTYFHRRRKLMKYLKRERFDKYNLMLVDYEITEEEIWEWGRLGPKFKVHPSRYAGLYESKVDQARREEQEAQKQEA